MPPAAVSFGSAELRACHFVTGEIQDPAIGGKHLLGASARLKSEGTHKNTGSVLHELQMPLAKKTSSLKSRTEDLPFLMAPRAALLSMYMMTRRPARISWKVQRPKMTPQTSRGLIWVALSERDEMSDSGHWHPVQRVESPSMRTAPKPSRGCPEASV